MGNTETRTTVEESMNTETRTAAELRLLAELALALRDLRVLQENARDATQRFGHPSSRSLAHTLLSEIEVRGSTTRQIEEVFRQRDIDPGHDSADANALRRTMMDRFYAAP